MVTILKALNWKQITLKITFTITKLNLHYFIIISFHRNICGAFHLTELASSPTFL